MAKPVTRAQFKDYCLRKLGAPVTEINVDDDQVEDRIDEAISYYNDYHFDGTDKVYYSYAVTQDDIDARYIQMPDNIIGAVNLFPVGMSSGSNNLFSIRYQLVANDLQMLTNLQLVPFYMVKQNIEFIEQMLVGQQPIRYNRINNRLYIDMDWSVLNVGQFIVVEAYQVVDPDVYTKMWSERWLQNYATVLIKEQWGSNLSKYTDMPLPGGVKFNGDKIYAQAVQDRKEMEEEMMSGFSLPSTDLIG